MTRSMTAPSGRFRTLTEKIKVDGLAAVYLHAEHDHSGRLVKVRLSSPGRYSDAQIGDLLDAVADAITAAIRESQ
jgi:hypothetical protein